MKDKDDLIRALDSVVWYNGLGPDILKWKELKPGTFGQIICPFHIQKRTDQLEMIWMLCVSLFGDYGSSPRVGWIEDVEGFRRFIDSITHIYRESEAFKHEHAV